MSEKDDVTLFLGRFSMSAIYALTAACVTSLLVVTAGATDSHKTIRPGEIWPDDRGRHINAHSDGVSKHVNTWCWFSA
jgi:hypothetical protein